MENSHQTVVVYSEEGVNGGTWGHPSLAINLARWISAEFSVWCDGHIFNLLATGSTSVKTSKPSKSPEWLQARLAGKDERRKLTDAIKEYIERHPELSENQRKYLYSNASESLNIGIFAKRSRQLKALLGLSNHSLLRDGLSLSENSCLCVIEYLACQFIEHEDLDPCEAVKKAINSSYSHQRFAKKYLDNDSLPAG